MNEFWNQLLEKVKNTFATPKTEITNLPATNSTNERLKIRLGFWQWFLGIFIVTLLTTLINCIFLDRATGMEEMNSYQKYTTDIMVLNENPVKKRMLAQFFANATPSPWLSRCWNNYYDEVNKEFILYNKRKDSLEKECDTLLKKKFEKKDSFTEYDDYKLKKMLSELNWQEIQEKSPVVTTNTKNSNPSAFDYEIFGFQNLINKDFKNAKLNFENAYELYPALHNVDEILKLLKKSNPEKDETKWNAIYNKILVDYPWGMPEDIKTKLEELTKK